MSVPVLKLWLQPLCIPAGKHQTGTAWDHNGPEGTVPMAVPRPGVGSHSAGPTNLRWERGWNCRLGNALIMPLWAWDTVGWKCQVKVPHLLWSLLFMLAAPGQWKGTILYFPTVLRDQGQAVGKKGKYEARVRCARGAEGYPCAISQLPSIAGRREGWDLTPVSATSDCGTVF